MIWKLLRRNISLWQIAGYSIASLVGLTIVLVAVQFYRDASHALSGLDDSDGLNVLTARYIVISKPVSLSSTLTGEAPSFTDEEIAELNAQPWVGLVAPFQAADFNVHAGVDMGGRGMRTALFLESVPDDILDVNPSEWGFNPEKPEIPIIISKDYLALYNFGFAASGRMPMISEGMLSAIPLQITLSGNGRSVTLPGHIAGYSSRLNTVAVPQSFMDWAHAEFGTGAVASPSRLVVKVDDPADPAVDRYFREHGYEKGGSDGDVGRAAFFLRLLTTVIVAVGLVITTLAFGILMLSLFLLVQKNQRTIAGLILLGYSPSRISACYGRLVCIVNAAVLVLSIVAMLCVTPLWRAPLSEIAPDEVSVLPSLIVGLALMLLVTLTNLLVIKNLVNKVFKNS